jgi:predicted NACHT family NTPase
LKTYRELLPVLIRCRELGQNDLCSDFTRFLTKAIYKTELLPEDAHLMKIIILERIIKGEVLLLVDGLDEILDTKTRIMFCEELQRITYRYPQTPIIVTSRIVGYREMPFRLGKNFLHCTISELSNIQKDSFVERWVDITEQHKTHNERESVKVELKNDLRSTNRIEKLSSSPMLLTTLLLVKRKVGKLPSKRTKLYREAISVLLNFNPIYETIKEEEAIPQLEYLAWEMCNRGVQQLYEEEILDCLDRIRDEYTNIRSLRYRTSEVFLDLLESRSSILVKMGCIWQGDYKTSKSIWEFRHLTFQEYFAARALIDGRYPNRPKSQSLAEQITEILKSYQHESKYVGDNAFGHWHESLRMVIADCKDDDVDEILLSLINAAELETNIETKRAIAILSLECLAEDINAYEITYWRVFIHSIFILGQTNILNYSEITVFQLICQIDPLLTGKPPSFEFNEGCWHIYGIKNANEYLSSMELPLDLKVISKENEMKLFWSGSNK